MAGVLFASGKVRLDVTAFLVVLALMLSGVLTVSEAVSGFGDPIVILIAALFVVGQALVDTGIAYRVGDWILEKGGGGETRLLVLLMLAAALLGAFMSSTAVVAIFIPIVIRISSRTGTSSSRLLMPLSYAALSSGWLTVIATAPNLVVSGALVKAGFEPFGFFSFTPVGLVAMAGVIVYMVVVGRRLMPSRPTEGGRPRTAATLREMTDRYAVQGRLARARLRPGSPLVEETAASAAIHARWGVHVLAVEREERFGLSLGPAEADTPYLEKDVIVIGGRPEDIQSFVEENQLEPLPVEALDRQGLTQTLGLAEVLVPPDSGKVGKSTREIGFRARFGLTVAAIRRRGKPLDGDVADQPLEAGDTLLVAGSWRKIRRLEPDPLDLLLLSLPAEIDEVAPTRDRAPLALATLAGMVLLMILGWIPMVATVLIAALVLVLGGCLTMERAYSSVDWSSLVLVAGLLPIADALDQTGGLDLVANGLLGVLEDVAPWVLMSVIFFLTAGLSLILSNTATALLVAPLAIRLALEMGLAPQPLAVTVVVAASAAFATPVSTPVVTLVVTPGGYRFVDFMRVGLPLVLVIWIVSLLTIPVLFPW